MTGQIYEDEHVHVRAKACDQCLLSKHRLVSAEAARRILAKTRSEDAGHFICHKSQVTDEHTSICRSWWDRFAMEDPVFRLAVLWGIIRWVEDKGAANY